ncbi:uncharacterized protein LOC144159552 isoform X2 [Haemaphysalis longicornis]
MAESETALLDHIRDHICPVTSASSESAVGQQTPELIIASNVVGQQTPELSTASNVVGQQTPELIIASNVIGQQTAKLSTARKVVGQQTPKLSTASNVVGQQTPKLSTASNVVSQQTPKLSTASNVVGQPAPKSSSASNVVRQRAPKLFSASNGEVYLGEGLYMPEEKLTRILNWKSELRAARETARHLWCNAETKIRSLTGQSCRQMPDSVAKQGGTLEKFGAVMNVVWKVVKDNPTEVPAARRIAFGRKAVKDIFAEMARGQAIKSRLRNSAHDISQKGKGKFSAGLPT